MIKTRMETNEIGNRKVEKISKSKVGSLKGSTKLTDLQLDSHRKQERGLKVSNQE